MADTDTTQYLQRLGKRNHVRAESTPFVWTDVIRTTMTPHIQCQTVKRAPKLSDRRVPAPCVKSCRMHEQDVVSRSVTPLVIRDVDPSNR